MGRIKHDWDALTPAEWTKALKTFGSVTALSRETQIPRRTLIEGLERLGVDIQKTLEVKKAKAKDPLQQVLERIHANL